MTSPTTPTPGDVYCVARSYGVDPGAAATLPRDAEGIESGGTAPHLLDKWQQWLDEGKK